MRLATTCCTRTSASVLKSCANRPRLASASHFSCTSMDSSRGLDRHRRATLAATSDAISAHRTTDGWRLSSAAMAARFVREMRSEEIRAVTGCLRDTRSVSILPSAKGLDYTVSYKIIAYCLFGYVSPQTANSRKKTAANSAKIIEIESQTNSFTSSCTDER